MLRNTLSIIALLFCALVGLCQMTPMSQSPSAELDLANKETHEDMSAILNDSGALPEELDDYINTLNNLASEIENAKWYHGSLQRSMGSLMSKRSGNKRPFNPQTRWGKRSSYGNRIPQTRWG